MEEEFFFKKGEFFLSPLLGPFINFWGRHLIGAFYQIFGADNLLGHIINIWGRQFIETFYQFLGHVLLIHNIFQAEMRGGHIKSHVESW